jgi:carboxymethylenebutenolidase
MTEVTIRAADGGSFSAYLAVPKSGKGPGIVLIQEIFGVNKVMRDLADGFAAQGYTAMCPDIFWRQQPGIQITDQTKEEWDQAFKLFQGFNVEKGIDDLKATLAAVRKHPACSGKVGSVGYCLGGKLAYLMATRSDSDANVGYYGVGIQDMLGEATTIKKPMVLHIAAKDQFVPPDAQAKIKAALKGNTLVTLFDYSEQDHAFARVGGQHYDKQAADDANKRTADFFKKHLA